MERDQAWKVLISSHLQNGFSEVSLPAQVIVIWWFMNKILIIYGVCLEGEFLSFQLLANFGLHFIYDHVLEELDCSVEQEGLTSASVEVEFWGAG